MKHLNNREIQEIILIDLSAERLHLRRRFCDYPADAKKICGGTALD